MAEQLTILAPIGGYAETLAEIRASYQGKIGVAGPPAAWTSLNLQFPQGSLVINSLIFVKKGDQFSSIVNGMRNFFRGTVTKAPSNKVWLSERLSQVQFMLGVVAENQFVHEDPRLALAFAIAKKLDGFMFVFGDTVMNYDGDRMLTHAGEFDVVAKPTAPAPASPRSGADPKRTPGGDAWTGKGGWGNKG